MHSADTSAKLRKTGIILLILLLVLSLLYVLGCGRKGENPHHLVLWNSEKLKTLQSLHRLDKDGVLYEIDYTADYYSGSALAVLTVAGMLHKTGCTGFVTESDTGSILTCRNYDYPHPDKNGIPQGMTIAVKCAPENGYRSIAFADGLIYNELGLSYFVGCVDDGKTDRSLFLLLPWLCMDGLNEKGLSVSIMQVDTKEGESPVCQTEKGRKSVIITQLTRMMLDSCATVEEAAELAAQCNMVNTVGYDYHLFVSDASGSSLVLEWRFDRLYVIPTDAATNFSLCADDAADCYMQDKLKELWLGAVETEREYHYGYGHGYERFKTVVRALDGCNSMSRSEARSLLAECSQQYSGEISSDTQYSVIYDNSNRTAEIWLRRSEDSSFLFAL